MTTDSHELEKLGLRAVVRPARSPFHIQQKSVLKKRFLAVPKSGLGRSRTSAREAETHSTFPAPPT